MNFIPPFWRDRFLFWLDTEIEDNTWQEHQEVPPADTRQSTSTII
jgi:hypothetical protein